MAPARTAISVKGTVACTPSPGKQSGGAAAAAVWLLDAPPPRPLLASLRGVDLIELSKLFETPTSGEKAMTEIIGDAHDDEVFDALRHACSARAEPCRRSHA